MGEMDGAIYKIFVQEEAFNNKELLLEGSAKSRTLDKFLVGLSDSFISQV
jgi:hypothetical protein